jgi:hypothetical protein
MDIKSFVQRNGTCGIADKDWGPSLMWLQDNPEIVKFSDIPVRTAELCLIEAVNLYAQVYKTWLRFGVRNIAKGLARALPEGTMTVTDGRNTVTVANVIRW